MHDLSRHALFFEEGTIQNCRRRRKLNPLHNESQGLATANTYPGHTSFLAVGMHSMHERRKNTGPSCSNGMSQRNGSAMHIDPGRIEWASGATLGNFTISFDGTVRFTRIDHEQTVELLSSQDPLGALTEAIGAMTTGGGDWVPRNFEAILTLAAGVPA